jgi:hypothetical protein
VNGAEITEKFQEIDQPDDGDGDKILKKIKTD